MITAANVREYFPAPRTENPLCGEPWWQVQGLGLFMALQLLRLTPPGPSQQQALAALRRTLDIALRELVAPPQDDIDRIFARTLAPWAPSDPEIVDAMLTLADLRTDDVLYDLGCGDGRIVLRAAAAYPLAKAVGLDIDGGFIAACEAQPRDQARTAFVQADVKTADLSEATVLTCYLVRASMNALREKFRALRPGTRIVSHAYGIEDWEPTRTQQVGDATLYLWVV